MTFCPHFYKAECTEDCKTYVAAHAAADEYETDIAKEDAENAIMVALLGTDLNLTAKQWEHLVDTMAHSFRTAFLTGYFKRADKEKEQSNVTRSESTSSGKTSG